MSCGRITIGSEPGCDDLPDAGTRARLILCNWSDVERIYTNDEGKIVNIILRIGKYGHEFLGFRSDVQKSDEVVRREQSKQRFTHAVSFVVYQQDQIQKTNLVNLVKGRFLAIVENKGKEVDSIEVLGRECGLQIVAGQIRNAYESGGMFTIGLATPDNGVEFEKKLPQTLGISYQNGLDIIDSLFVEDVGIGLMIIEDTFIVG